MQANIRYVCREYTGGYVGGDFPISEEETIRTLIDKSLSESGAQAVPNLLDITIVMKNGKPAKLDDQVLDGDKVFVLQQIMGG